MDQELNTQKTGGIYKAIVEIMREVDCLKKERTNSKQAYNFRGIDDVYNVFHPHLVTHGVFTAPIVKDIKRTVEHDDKGRIMIFVTLIVEYTFWHTDGSSLHVTTVGEGLDYGGDKAAAKAMSCAHKYAFFQLFSIPTDEPKDAENDSCEISVSQDTILVDRLAAACKKNNISRDDAKFLLGDMFSGKQWKDLTTQEKIQYVSKIEKGL